jgi:hypothetical protein
MANPQDERGSRQPQQGGQPNPPGRQQSQDKGKPGGKSNQQGRDQQQRR